MRVVIINLIISDLILYIVILIFVIFFFNLLFYFRNVLINSFILINLISIFYIFNFNINNNKKFVYYKYLIARLILNIYILLFKLFKIENNIKRNIFLIDFFIIFFTF